MEDLPVKNKFFILTGDLFSASTSFLSNFAPSEFSVSII